MKILLYTESAPPRLTLIVLLHIVIRVSLISTCKLLKNEIKKKRLVTSVVFFSLKMNKFHFSVVMFHLNFHNGCERHIDCRIREGWKATGF